MISQVKEIVKGFRDITGEEAKKREKVKEIIIKNFRLYGFEPAETPVIEFEDFVKGDNETDEAVSDIFRLKDKGERNLALRYEFTFQLKRLAENKKLPYKRYQIGEVFRDEPVSSNRYRQFTQCDADVVGSTLREEAEILALISRILKELKIDAEIQINSRKLMNSFIKSVGIENVEFVLREIDKLEKIGEDNVKQNLAKFIEKDKIIALFKMLNKPISYFKKYEGYKELKQLLEYCKEYNIETRFVPSLARGLSYYNTTVFEVKCKNMKDTVAGGGSYLVNNIQSTGFAFGFDRLTQLANISTENTNLLIISINQDSKAISLAEKLRKKGISVTIAYKVSKGLEYANSMNIKNVIFIGEDEVKKKKYKLRDMKTGKEEMIKERELIEKLAGL